MLVAIFIGRRKKNKKNHDIGDPKNNPALELGSGPTNLGLVDTKWRCNFSTFALIGDAPSGFTHA